MTLGAWVISFLALSGLGRPNGYRYGIGSTQVFENAEGVVVFAAIDLVTYRPGLLQEPRVVRSPVRLYRIDVGPDGTIKRQILSCPAGDRYLLSIEPIVKLPGGLYILEMPSRGHPADQLHRILGDRIEPLSPEETRSVLDSFSYSGGGSSEADRVTERNGWRLIDRSRYSFRRYSENVISHRHQIRLRLVDDGASESMIVESSEEGERWSVTLLNVKTQRWRSYQRPSVTE